jgi:hypothetical protein
MCPGGFGSDEDRTTGGNPFLVSVEGSTDAAHRFDLSGSRRVNAVAQAVTNEKTAAS